ncbi:hypothetical protein ASPFODRAFT_212357 [Aspergillus luchuensis CBS 106.47]|uniref:Uncharacterized protein n=1 Tax=Aspergillus luchuensis (strain CBS 106.47) TaxID=1137211 RepID=A0A1M3T1K0_ASPLC|nr:hypothetical protein ASPFODRAFT_212357 [Aspergillus luchuensis CBS 106.47]
MVIRDAINTGTIPGPRFLANGREIARTGGELVDLITAYTDGLDEMRAVVQNHIALGVDQIKLSMLGELITQIRDAEICYFAVALASCMLENPDPKLHHATTLLRPKEFQWFNSAGLDFANVLDDWIGKLHWDNPESINWVSCFSTISSAQIVG